MTLLEPYKLVSFVELIHLVHVIPSGEVRMVPELPTATNNGLDVVVVVLLSSLLFLAQEKMMKLKRKRESIMSICFTWFPISGLG